MFFRTKVSRGHRYLQIVENHREGKQTKQQVIATLGNLDTLQESGRLEALLQSGARFVDKMLLLRELKEKTKDGADGFPVRRIGPALIFERLWKETGCQAIVKEMLRGTRYQFRAERAIFLTVLHRLFAPGSDRAAEKWAKSYEIDGVEDIQLQHLYRAMFWLGKPLPGRRGTPGFPLDARRTLLRKPCSLKGVTCSPN